MLVGNCSLSLYPVTDATRGEVSDLFAYIEDFPRHLYDDAVPWTWSDYAGYRDVVNATGTGINLAGLVGHSMLRLVAMGADAWTRAATDEESAAMAAILREAMAEGAWGLSTSFLDVDQSGRPVPSRQAEGPEFDALFDVLQEAGRGVVEVVPDLLGSTAMDTLRDLGQRCGERGVPITWTGFTYVDSAPHRTQRWIDVATELAEQGTLMYPQLSPRTVDMRLNWDSSMMFMSMPEGWHKVVAASGADMPALLESPEWRAAAREEWDRTKLAMFPVNRLDVVRIVEVVGPENERWLGRTVADVVAERGGHPSDVLADFVLGNDCRPGLVATGMANSDVEGVAQTLKNPAVLISSSDSGAHAQMMCSSGDTTLLLTRHVRERGDFTLEDAIYQLTGRQADVFGFQRRGVLAPGNVADLNVFALDELTYGGDEFVKDLPQGGVRMRRPTGGYRSTLLGGTIVQQAGERTGALPGRVISSIG
jgi:N-acyl-D-amino-acid deacylase